MWKERENKTVELVQAIYSRSVCPVWAGIGGEIADAYLSLRSSLLAVVPPSCFADAMLVLKTYLKDMVPGTTQPLLSGAQAKKKMSLDTREKPAGLD